jgi:putative hydrolase of the HAD superfamily
MQTQTQKTLICFDLDDTLIDDNWKFETTFCDCIKAILLGLAAKAPQINEILQTAREIDNKLLKSLPKEEQYQPTRLIKAWKETYVTLSEKKEIPVKEHILQMIESYIWQNFEPPYFVIAGAVDTIMNIKRIPNVDLRLEILTIGDKNIQRKKAELSRLSHYFDHIEVVYNGDGKYEYLAKQAEIYGKENVYMVGNSIKSDINPALNAGVNAIYIPRGSWHVNNTDVVNDKYITAKRIFELDEKFEEMFANKNK